MLVERIQHPTFEQFLVRHTDFHLIAGITSLFEPRSNKWNIKASSILSSSLAEWLRCPQQPDSTRSLLIIQCFFIQKWFELLWHENSLQVNFIKIVLFCLRNSFVFIDFIRRNRVDNWVKVKCWEIRI